MTPHPDIKEYEKIYPHIVKLQELAERYRSFPNVIDFMFARAIASGFQRIGFSRL